MLIYNITAIMSAQSLLKGYDGELPTLAFSVGGPGTAPNLAEVLAEGASANDLAITDISSLTGSTTGLFTVAGGAGEGVSVVGPVGVSLVATTGGCKVEATAGTLELNADDAAGNLNIVLNANKLSAFTISASNGPTYTGSVRQLKIQVGGVDYWIALNPAAFT